MGSLDLRTRFFAGLGLSSKARLRELAAALLVDDGRKGTPASSSAVASMPAMRRAIGVRVSASSEVTFSGEVRAWDAT